MTRLLALALLAALAPAHAATPACDVAHIKGLPELTALLKKRAIEAIDLAAKTRTAKADGRLAELVAPDAAFGLGAGDLGLSMEHSGPEGAREMAAMMDANMFLIAGWDYTHVPTDTPCAETKVTVEFLNNTAKMRSAVEFTFIDGRMVKADGWRGGYVTGPMTKVPK